MNAVPFGTQLRIAGDRVWVVGINFETSRISILARNEHSIVLRVEGRSCWVGNYMPREYHSPLIMVYRVVADRGNELDVEPLIEWEVKRKPKETK